MYRIFIITVLMTIYWLANAFTGHGTVEKLIADDFQNNKFKTIYMLHTKEGSFELKLSDTIKKTLETGDVLYFDGRIERGRLKPSVIPKHIKSNQSAASSDRSVLVLILDYNNMKATNHTSVDEVSGILFTNEKSVKNNYLLSSFGKVRFHEDLSNVMVLNIDSDLSQDMNAGNIASQALEIAKSKGIDVDVYQHKMFIIPKEYKAGWAGLGSLGCNRNCRSWIRGYYPLVYAHELGHNIGFGHASVDSDGDGNIDSEYGDHSGIMGNAGYRLINGPHRLYAEWYDDLPDLVKEMSPDVGKYVTSLELDPATSKVNAHVLMVTKPGMPYKYALTYRTNTGIYGMGEKYSRKVNVHRYDGKRRSVFVAALSIGDKFYDSYNGIKIRATRTKPRKGKVKFSTANRCGFKEHPCKILSDKPLTDLDGKNNFIKVEVPEGTNELMLEAYEAQETSTVNAKIRYGSYPKRKSFYCKVNSKKPAKCSIMAPDAGEWYIKATSKKAHQGLIIGVTLK